MSFRLEQKSMTLSELGRWIRIYIITGNLLFHSMILLMYLFGIAIVASE